MIGLWKGTNGIICTGGDTFDTKTLERLYYRSSQPVLFTFILPLVLVVKTTCVPFVGCTNFVGRRAEVRLLLLAQLLELLELTYNLTTFVVLRKFSAPLNSGSRLWRKFGAFQIASAMIGVVTSKTHDLASLSRCRTVRGLITTTSTFV